MPHRRGEFSAIRRVSFRVLAATKTPALSLCAGKMNQWNRVSRHLALDSKGTRGAEIDRAIGPRDLKRQSVDRDCRSRAAGPAWSAHSGSFLGNGHAIRTKCRTPTPWHFADETNYASGSALLPTCRSTRSRTGNLTDGRMGWVIARSRARKEKGPRSLRTEGLAV